MRPPRHYESIERQESDWGFGKMAFYPKYSMTTIERNVFCCETTVCLDRCAFFFCAAGHHPSLEHMPSAAFVMVV